MSATNESDYWPNGVRKLTEAEKRSLDALVPRAVAQMEAETRLVQEAARILTEWHEAPTEPAIAIAKQLISLFEDRAEEAFGFL